MSNDTEKQVVAKKTASKTATKTPTSIRQKPSDAESHEARQEQAKSHTKEVTVKTTHGGRMWDYDCNAWIEAKATITVETQWLKNQVAAGKVEILK